MNAIDEYIALADAWGASMDDCDSETANALHDRIHEVFQCICQNKRENDLFDRAGTTSDAACLFIASNLKDRDRKRAMSLYKRLTGSPRPFVAMSARQILDDMTLHGG
jgi:hypothetical protein